MQPNTPAQGQEHAAAQASEHSLTRQSQICLAPCCSFYIPPTPSLFDVLCGGSPANLNEHFTFDKLINNEVSFLDSPAIFLRPNEKPKLGLQGEPEHNKKEQGQDSSIAGGRVRWVGSVVIRGYSVWANAATAGKGSGGGLKRVTSDVGCVCFCICLSYTHTRMSHRHMRTYTHAYILMRLYTQTSMQLGVSGCSYSMCILNCLFL